MKPLSAADIQIDLDDGACEGAIVSGTIVTPYGSLVLTAVVERFDHELVLAGLHMHGENLGPNTLGPARLKQIALAVAEELDVEAITIGGATRTTGAGTSGARGRVPRPIRFTRSLSP